MCRRGRVVLICRLKVRILPSSPHLNVSARFSLVSIQRVSGHFSKILRGRIKSFTIFPFQYTAYRHDYMDVMRTYTSVHAQYIYTRVTFRQNISSTSAFSLSVSHIILKWSDKTAYIWIRNDRNETVRERRVQRSVLLCRPACLLHAFSARNSVTLSDVILIYSGRPYFFFHHRQEFNYKHEAHNW